MPNTTRLNLITPSPTQTADIPTDMGTLASGIDVIAAAYYQQSSAPTPLLGAFWWNTNVSTLYYSDGTSWYVVSNAIYQSASAPSVPYTGQFWYNNATGALSYYTGSAWNTIVPFNTPAPSASGQVLTSTGTTAATWQTPAVNASNITGNLPVANGGTGATATTGTGSNVLAGSPTLTGTPVLATPTATSVTNTGISGATTSTRWVGGTASGAPAAGTFLKGDMVISQTGDIYICTTAGTPGTWTQVGNNSSPSASNITAGTLQSGVNVPIARLQGSGDIPSGITVPYGQISGNGNLPSGIKVNQSQVNNMAVTTVAGTSYTVSLSSDPYAFLLFSSASAVAVTIPTGGTVGTQLNLIQGGAGQVTLSGASGVTIISNGTANTPKLRTTASVATALCTSSNTWYVFGDIA